jgi:hypothetical protein
MYFAREKMAFSYMLDAFEQVSEPEHPITSEVENVVGVRRLFQKELKVF